MVGGYELLQDMLMIACAHRLSSGTVGVSFLMQEDEWAMA